MAAARPIGSTPGGAPVCAFPASAALKPIKLTRTAKGWSAFEMLFKAHLGSQLSASLNMAMVNKMMVATDARQAALFKHIFDRLVIALENETDLIESIAENCMADNGIEAFLHIKQLMVGQSTASSIMGIDKIITASIGSNTHVDASAIVSTNASLADDVRLTDRVISTIILSKLPMEHVTLRDIVIERDELPTTKALLEKIKQRTTFATTRGETSAPVTLTARNMSTSICFNCGERGHYTQDCSKPKLPCELCGTVGHIKKFCFVQNDRLLPSNWSEDRKAEIAKKRADYKAKAAESKAVSMVISDIYGVSI